MKPNKKSNKPNKNPQYFEGTLQLRNPSQELIDFVATEIENSNAWIAKTKKQKNGIDLLLSSNKFLKDIGKKLKNKFAGELTTSSKLFTRNKQTSKEVHRGCVLFRYYDIKEGDKILFKGETLEIISIGKEIFARNLDNNNKKVHLKFEKLRDGYQLLE
jgi:NMD protein affecting ribosome stability and mRNA decay